MRRTGLLAAFAGRTLFSDDEIATQSLADREDVSYACVHGARHVRCYRCLDIELLHIRASRIAVDPACRLRRKSRKVARRLLRHSARRRAHRGMPCVHARTPASCLTCIDITAIYVRDRWRHATPGHRKQEAETFAKRKPAYSIRLVIERGYPEAFTAGRDGGAN
jgi:hypothetical protein